MKKTFIILAILPLAILISIYFYFYKTIVELSDIYDETEKERK